MPACVDMATFAGWSGLVRLYSAPIYSAILSVANQTKLSQHDIRHLEMKLNLAALSCLQSPVC